MKFKKYLATYYARNEKTDELMPIGTQIIFYFEKETLSLSGKAYANAQGKQKDAVGVGFEEI